MNEWGRCVNVHAKIENWTIKTNEKKNDKKDIKKEER